MTTKHERFMDLHYPRCPKCNLRVYRSNLTGSVCAEVTSDPGCPDWDNPERVAYPYVGSEHILISR